MIYQEGENFSNRLCLDWAALMLVGGSFCMIFANS